MKEQVWYLGQGANGFHVQLQRVPFWFNLLYVLVMDYLSFDWLGWCKLPNWKLVRYEGEWYTLKEWYGDLGELLYAWILWPLVSWCADRSCDYDYVKIDVSVGMAIKIDSEFVDEVLDSFDHV